MKICPKCGGSGKRFIKSLNVCDRCHKNYRSRILLPPIVKEFKPASDYNQYLFNLYLTYIKRYNLNYTHLKQAIRLKMLLEKEPWPVFSSWLDIYECSEKFKLYILPRLSNKKGCAIRKIGYMLQELGILTARSDEFGNLIKNALKDIDNGNLLLMKQFLDFLTSTKRAPATAYGHICNMKDLYLWLKKSNGNVSLLNVNHETIKTYIDSLQILSIPSFIHKRFRTFSVFYTWAKFSRLIVVNPCEKIHLSKPARHLQICSPEQTKKLFSFIKNPKSNPDHAFLLSLVLFFGLTIEDLAFATLIPGNEFLSLSLRRKPLTFGRSHYCRKKTFKLPLTPTWFLDLQKRFYAVWRERYKKINIKGPFYLVLPYQDLYLRPVGKSTIRNRFASATKDALGYAIPARFIRQTCGHIHTNGNDASMLGHIGWSRRHIFSYTWVPRVFIKPKT